MKRSGEWRGVESEEEWRVERSEERSGEWRGVESGERGPRIRPTNRM